MTRIIDLGNGYGRLERYGSGHASLTFPLGLSVIRRLHKAGYLDGDKMIQVLEDAGYSPAETRWIIAVDSVTIEQ